MDHQVLARKWRPRTLPQMVGQETILRILKNALLQNRIHHAYLFTGTRGVGKTTLARILAKCLNCESGITADPCQQCAACLAIDAGQFLDLYEVDAASRTKVEDTRELLDNVLYPPTQGRFKIYLIDEVHMLSNHSFNALLKTLEEPPSHVKFLLATTEPKRLPITILSRCLQFRLKPITVLQIADHLHSICTAEKISSERSALEQLALAAEGSMRDALSLLDQAIAYGQGSVNLNDVSAMLGSLSQDDLLPLLNALAQQDGKALFAAIALLSEQAPDFQQVLAELVQIWHHIAVAQLLPETLATDSPLMPYLSQFTSEQVQLYYQIALLGRRDLALSPTPQQGFEMTMLRMLAFYPELSSNRATVSQKAPSSSTPSHAACIESTKEKAIVTELSSSLPEWRQLLDQLELSGMAYALAANCTLLSFTENKIALALAENHRPLLNAKSKERIAEALIRHFAKPLQLEIQITHNEISTPLKQKQVEEKQQLTEATQQVMNNPTVQKLIEMYDASVEVSLLN